MFNKFKTTPPNEASETSAVEVAASEEAVTATDGEAVSESLSSTTAAAKNTGVMGMLQSKVSKPSILSEGDRKSTRLNSSHVKRSRMPSSA